MCEHRRRSGTTVDEVDKTGEGCLKINASRLLERSETRRHIPPTRTEPRSFLPLTLNSYFYIHGEAKAPNNNSCETTSASKLPVFQHQSET